MDGSEFFQPELMYAIISWPFTICYFLEYYSERHLVYILQRAFFKFFFYTLFIHLAFLFFLWPYFLQNYFVFFMSNVWIILMHSPPIRLSDFFSLLGNDLFCLYCSTHYQYPLSHPSLTNIFWFISSSSIVILVCVFIFSSQYIFAYFS